MNLSCRHRNHAGTERDPNKEDNSLAPENNAGDADVDAATSGIGGKAAPNIAQVWPRELTNGRRAALMLWNH